MARAKKSSCNTQRDTKEARMTRRYGHFIDNRFTSIEAKPTIERVSPVNDQVVAHFAEGNEEDIRAAVRAARTAFDSGPWPHMDAGERAAILRTWSRLVADNRERL